jgi:arylsulfatase A-like enzyme/predicted Zn-dependent protease
VARPFRYTLILAAAAVGTVLAAFGGWRYARASAPLSGPIIIISIDSLRPDHLPVYGYHQIKTPAIDGLAADGVVFDRAYSHAPQTLPAHIAVLTGRLPFETGIRDDVGFVVKAGERLLPQMLRERGYATAGIVSTYLLRKETGIGQGFDFFDGDTSPGPTDLPAVDGQRDGSRSEAIAERWLDTVRSSRAFLFLHLYEPHKPYAPPARFSPHSTYDGEIAYSDEIVGRLVQYLKSHQLYDRSTIILMSDHGEGLGEHGEQGHGLFLYDEAIHVPLIIKQESNVAAGRRVADLVQHIDVVPTILDLVKAPIPGALRGRSLKPLLEGTGRLPERAVYSEALYGRYHFGWSELTALTDARHRYIKAPTDELYDLSRDPHERESIVRERTQALEAMRTTLEGLSAGTTIQQPAPLPREARERLRALGYGASNGSGAAAAAGVRPDAKDKHQLLEAYRKALDLAADRKWMDAIALLQRILRDDPGMVEVWDQLAGLTSTIDRLDLTVDAYKHIIELRPADAAAHLGLAGALLQLKRFDDARVHAELADELAGDRDVSARATAHELLARIGLARHSADTARREAGLVRQSDPSIPMPSYIEARLLYDQGHYDEALPLFEETLAALKKSGGAQIAELHLCAADTLMRLGRYESAETEFLEELVHFPKEIRARSGLATLYQTTGRPEAAARVVQDLVRINPTPDAYALAARLWKSLGNIEQVNALRAEARRTFHR